MIGALQCWLSADVGLQIFLGRLSRLCCVTDRSYSFLDNRGAGSGRPVGRQLDLYDLEPDQTDDVARHSSPTASSSSATLEQTLSDIRNYLRILAAAAGRDGDVGVRQVAGPSHRDLVVGEWQRVALVIDRVSFTFFTFITIVVAIALYAH